MKLFHRVVWGGEQRPSWRYVLLTYAHTWNEVWFSFTEQYFNKKQQQNLFSSEATGILGIWLRSERCGFLDVRKLSTGYQVCSLNLSFVNDIYVDGGKLARNGQKTAILVGWWGRLPIDDEYAALLWRFFDFWPWACNHPVHIIKPALCGG